MTYPPIAAGQRITGNLLTAMLPVVITKPATTERADTATPTIDPDLQIELAGSAVYFVEFHLMPAAIADADWRTNWVVPAGASGLKAVMGPSTVAANSQADNITMRAGVHQFETQVVVNGVRNGNSLAFYVHEWGIVRTGAAGGTCGIAWAQGTSNPTPSRLFADSVMIARRIG